MIIEVTDFFSVILPKLSDIYNYLNFLSWLIV
jgi:hypothetical protein